MPSYAELWKQEKGFSILEVHRANKFTDGNFTKASQDNDHVILRAAQYGMPDIETRNSKTITIAKRYYFVQKQHAKTADSLGW